jgi:hypothetical protein
MEYFVHNRHDHVHGPGCGHVAIRHQDHIDYVHDGHLHHPHDGHVDEHQLEAAAATACEPAGSRGGHAHDHVHGVGCEHAAVPHEGHIDYLVDGELHRQHGEHCDTHGFLDVIAGP